MPDKRAYFKLDVGYLSNPKIASLLDNHPRAILLHLECIAYATQHLTDGLVPMRLAMRLACAEQCDLDLLLQCGLLLAVDESNIAVHDYLEHQRSASEVKAAADKGKRAAEARWTNAPSNAPSMPDALPNPMPREKERERDIGGRKRATQIPPDFQPSDANVKYANDNGIDLDHELEQFKNHHLAKGSTFKNWNAALRTWLGNANKWTRPALKAVGQKQWFE